MNTYVRWSSLEIAQIVTTVAHDLRYIIEDHRTGLLTVTVSASFFDLYNSGLLWKNKTLAQSVFNVEAFSEIQFLQKHCNSVIKPIVLDKVVPNKKYL